MNIQQLLEKAITDKRLCIYFRDLSYVRSFTLSEFKDFFNVKTIEVRKHESGFLYFKFRDTIGLVMDNKLPIMSLGISIVVDQFGDASFVIHNLNYKPKNFTITLLERVGESIFCTHDYESETLDAFEGDPDARWNID